ncbi:hypothetical protein CRE_22720 [Caenorhabditis remanei]|uniref:Uncharacterized protein n=1 Tax=Caenorhabditis remanei TaxID=31234 RepID=E3NKF2_CAERE|nr:hypothetical protein CRE_22720 [Caenorhabditis remanei]
MLVVDGSRDTWINDFCEEIVEGLKKVFRENAEHRKEVLRHERWRVAKKREQIKKNVSEQKQEWAEKQVHAQLRRKRKLKKLKKRRKEQRKKVMKIRRRTWIAFRVFVMIFRSEIVTLDKLGIESKTYKYAISSPISLEKTFVPRNKKKKKLKLCYGYRKSEHG